MGLRLNTDSNFNNQSPIVNNQTITNPQTTNYQTGAQKIRFGYSLLVIGIFLIIVSWLLVIPSSVAHGASSLEAQALYEQGNICAEAKDFVSAKKFYEYSVKADPNFALGHNGLGFAYFKLGGLDSAEAEYNEALKRDPKLAVAYNNLGIVYYHKYGFWGSSESSSLDKAIDYYKKAIEIKPDYAKAMVNMSVAYAKKGDLWNAYLIYQKAGETDAKYIDERKKGEQAQKEIGDLKNKYPNIDIKALEVKYGSGEGK